MELFEMQAQISKQQEEEENQRRSNTTSGKPKVKLTKKLIFNVGVWIKREESQCLEVVVNVENWYVNTLERVGFG